MTSFCTVGDCRDVLAAVDPDTFASCVTDPPYDLTNRVVDFLKCRVCGARGTGGDSSCRCGGELYRQRSGGGGFMGKDWDSTGVAFDPETWRAVLRVMKPGACLLAFGGTRTFHRMTVAIEDAGFEIRDCLMWLYGSGFPKSLDVSKAIDKAAGAEREIIETIPDRWAGKGNVFQRSTQDEQDSVNITAPATPEAQQWDGWGTALKPAWEPIILARKPLGEKTVAANVLRHGTGGINIDGCRIETADGLVRPNIQRDDNEVFDKGLGAGIQDEPLGRWPANLILDEEAGALLDEQTGISTSRIGKPRGSASPGEGWGTTMTERGHNDFGGASRFFYCAKASRSERNLGLDDFPDLPSGMRSETSGQHITRRDGGDPAPTKNNHPTVKPIALMRYLVRLVTPPGGMVLDPFLGSGSTGCASELEGFDFAGIDLSVENVAIAERRIEHWRLRNPDFWR